MSAPADDATTAEATTAVVDPAATAPAPAVDASGQPAKKPGFLARLTGTADEVEQLRGELQAEKDAHASTTAKLQTAEGELTAYRQMETKAEARFDALQGQLAAATAESARLKAELATAQQAAATAGADADKKVGAQVADTLATLGVEPADLPAATTPADQPGKADHGHLKGRDKVVAAFNAQFAAK